jgi:hypothetical protein
MVASGSGNLKHRQMHNVRRGNQTIGDGTQGAVERSLENHPTELGIGLARDASFRMVVEILVQAIWREFRDGARAIAK